MGNCTTAFAELQTEVSDFPGDASVASIPYWNYTDYLQRVLQTPISNPLSTSIKTKYPNNKNNNYTFVSNNIYHTLNHASHLKHTSDKTTYQPPPLLGGRGTVMH